MLVYLMGKLVLSQVVIQFQVTSGNHLSKQTTKEKDKKKTVSSNNFENT